MILLNLNPRPPPKDEILALPFLAVLAVALFQYVVYTKAKRLGYRTCSEVLRLEMVILKSAITYTVRLISLVAVLILPLIGTGLSTELFVLSVLFIIHFLHIKVLSPLFINTYTIFINIISFLLFYLIVGKFMPDFMDKYGAIYKLPLMAFLREDIKQFFKKHLDIFMALLIGFVAYVDIVIDLLVILLNVPSNMPSFLLKIVVGIIVAFLLLDVLRNKKYDNAFRLVEKITKVQR